MEHTRAESECDHAKMKQELVSGLWFFFMLCKGNVMWCGVVNCLGSCYVVQLRDQRDEQ